MLWEQLLCADGLVVMAETVEDLAERLGAWKDSLENGSMGLI